MNSESATQEQSVSVDHLPSEEDIRLELIRLDDMLLNVSLTGLDLVSLVKRILLDKQAFLKNLQELVVNEHNSVANTLRSKSA